MDYLSSDFISPFADSVDITISCEGYDDFTIENFPIPFANFEGENHEESSVEGEAVEYEYPEGNTITVSSYNSMDGANIEIQDLPDEAKVTLNPHEPEE